MPTLLKFAKQNNKWEATQMTHNQPNTTLSMEMEHAYHE